MKSNNLIKKASILGISLTLLTSSITFAHPGRTDGSGGHRDKNNVSGLGSYHYHHGFPAHLHPNGVCSYTSKPTVKPTPSKKPSISNNNKVYARVPNFPVKISGKDINTSNAQYAPLHYNYITYIPLTSDILEHLNLSYKWNDPNNLIFNRNSNNINASKQFLPAFMNGSSWYGNTLSVTKPNKGIIVNGKGITNKYPIVSSKNINYLPLTTDIITSLGLTGGWNEVDGFNLHLK